MTGGGCSDEAKAAARKASRDLRRQRADTSGGGTRSKEREHFMIKFILSVLHTDKDPSIDFADWIKSGEILMRLMTTISLNSVPVDPYPRAGEHPEETIVRNLIQTMKNYGVHEKYLFTVNDLWDGKNIPKVVRCLEEVEKLALLEEHLNLCILPANKLYT